VDFGLIERVEVVVVVLLLFLFYWMEVMGLFFFYFLCMERLEVISGRLIVSLPWIKAVITTVFL
jgi:hypothetical protein